MDPENRRLSNRHSVFFSTASAFAYKYANRYKAPKFALFLRLWVYRYLCLRFPKAG